MNNKELIGGDESVRDTEVGEGKLLMESDSKTQEMREEDLSTETALEIQETPREEYSLGEAIRLKPKACREELRRLERQMEREEKSNKIALMIISVFMFLLVLMGMLFVLAPEFLEKLLY